MEDRRKRHIKFTRGGVGRASSFWNALKVSTSQHTQIGIMKFLHAAALSLLLPLSLSTPAAPKGSYVDSEGVWHLELIEGDAEPARRSTPPSRGRGRNEGEDQATSREKAVAKAKADAEAKRTAEEKARLKEADDAAREFLLRLGDEPLEHDSYIVEKAWDRLKRQIPIPNGVAEILKSLSPTDFGKESWLDLAKTKQEMLGARRLLQLEDEQKASADRQKADNERMLGLPVTPKIPEQPAQEPPEQKRFLTAMRGIASAKSDDVAFVFDQLLRRSRPESDFPLSDATLSSVVRVLAPLTPANACRVTARWACPMVGGKIGEACTCPGLGNGTQVVREMSEFCSGAL